MWRVNCGYFMLTKINTQDSVTFSQSFKIKEYTNMGNVRFLTELLGIGTICLNNYYQR